MLVRMGLLNRRKDLSLAEFADYWRKKHSKIVCEQIPALKAYTQNLIVDHAQRGIDFKRSSVSFDGIAQLTFDSIDQMRAQMGPPVVTALMADEAEFIGAISAVTTLRNVVVPPPKSGKFVKRMSTLRKHPDISMSEFQHEWFNVHSFLVKRIPGIIGYRQNLVIERPRKNLVESNAGNELEVDGIVELWFENLDAIEPGFRTNRGLTTMTHAKEFISEISTFMVDAIEIISE